MTRDRKDALALGLPPTLADVVDAYREMLYLPDPRSVYVVLATVVANKMEVGDPVWLMLIAGSGRGKTETLMPLADVPGVVLTGDVTVGGLLSGTSKKERAANANGGLLREIGTSGILVVKDFGSILSMQREQRDKVMHALREIYDGSWVRDVGTDGGQRLAWEGKLGLIGAATTAIDRHHSVIAALGERWVSFRIAAGGDEEMVAASVGMTETHQTRLMIRRIVRQYVESLDIPDSLRPLAGEELQFLQGLAPIVCAARSPVIRNAYGREIDFVGDTEGPGRISRQLHKLLVATEAMGLTATESRELVMKVAMDSIASPRREVLTYLLTTHESVGISDVEAATGLNTTMARRGCEELAAQDVVEMTKQGDGDKAPWSCLPAPATAARWAKVTAAFPEKAVGVAAAPPIGHDRSTSALPDISGNRHDLTLRRSAGTS